jgi:hypothetical protein
MNLIDFEERIDDIDILLVRRAKDDFDAFIIETLYEPLWGLHG